MAQKRADPFVQAAPFPFQFPLLFGSKPTLSTLSQACCRISPAIRVRCCSSDTLLAPGLRPLDLRDGDGECERRGVVACSWSQGALPVVAVYTASATRRPTNTAAALFNEAGRPAPHTDGWLYQIRSMLHSGKKDNSRNVSVQDDVRLPTPLKYY